MPTDAVHHLGATTKPAPMVTVDPQRLVTEEQLEAIAGDTGLNGAFLADTLSDVLMHCRCGLHLFRSIGGRSNNSVLAERYERAVHETQEGIAVVERLIADLGGDPGYVSPMARATEKLDMGALEGTFLLAGSVDPLTQELVMVNAALLFATVDRSSWETLAALAEDLDDEPVRGALSRAVEQVLPTARDRFEWADRMRQQMISLQAEKPALRTVGLSASALLDKVHSLFEDSPVTG